jgi:membrane protein required for colicin V production
VIVSAVYATYRGFVSETLSIFAWAAAAFATLFFGPKLAPLARHLVSPPFLGMIVGYALIFMVVLIPLSFMSFRFAQSVKNSPVGTLDRSLGAVFGLVRGLAIVGLAYIAYSYITPVRSQPDWLAQSRSLPLIRGSAQAILSLVPDQHIQTARADVGSGESGPAAAPVPRARPQSAPKRAEKSYGAQDRRALDRLIETTGGSDDR